MIHSRFLLLAVALLAMNGRAQVGYQQWYAEATRRYPDLANPSSRLTSKFNELYRQKRAADRDFFNRENWPMLLAQQASMELGLKDQKMKNPALATPPLRAPDAPGLRLTKLWWSRTGTSSGGGSQTLRDLQLALTGIGRANPTLDEFPDEPVYNGVRYLESLVSARAKLKLTTTVSAKTKVSCPGFPEPLYYYSWDIKGAYNRLYIVTDITDQVVSVQLVDETERIARAAGSTDFHTYNFVLLRCKAKTSQTILLRSDPKSQWDATCVRTSLIDNGKCLEDVAWYVPTPLANVLMYCIKQNQLPR